MSKISRLVGSLSLVLVVSLGLVAPGQANGVASSADTSAAAKPKPKPNKWEAFSGPFFNDPHLAKGHFQIERRVIKTINNTPKGSSIRIAIYSFDRLPVAHALVAAHRRGVQVQMLLNDHWETPAMKVVRAEIGKNRGEGSFIYKCKQSCRGAANEFNNLHTKFYLFSQAGKSEDVLAVGSANMTRNAAVHQWNDLYFTSRRPRAVPPVRGALQGHAQGLRHPSGAVVLLRHPDRSGVRRLGRQAHRRRVPAGLEAEGRPGGPDARPHPVPDSRR